MKSIPAVLRKEGGGASKIKSGFTNQLSLNQNKIMDNEYNEDFSGVFMFTNPTKKERKYLWNNKEYVFPAESTVPLIIPSETLENIQEIRKRFAYRMAEERLYEGEITEGGYNYKKAKEMGGGIPPTFDAKIL